MEPALKEMGQLRRIVALEELFFLLLAVFLFAELPYEWWWFAVLFFAPDLSMMGYVAGPRAGAVVYNLFHHRAIAIAAYIAGALLGSEILELAGVVMLGHSSLDRMVGYGLKHPDSFRHTHLGWMGERPGDESA